MFARYTGLFVVIVWAWMVFTLYTNRFDTDDLVFRLAKSGAMVAIAALAVNLHRLMAGDEGTWVRARIRRPSSVAARPVRPGPTPCPWAGPQAG